jgi:hypothetical protein
VPFSQKAKYFASERRFSTFVFDDVFFFWRELLLLGLGHKKSTLDYSGWLEKNVLHARFEFPSGNIARFYSGSGGYFLRQNKKPRNSQ